MNKRDLRSALDTVERRPDIDTGGRMVAYLLAHERVAPRKLRDALHETALACLLCDTHEHAPANHPTRYADLYRRRAAAFLALGEAALAVYRKPKTTIEPDTIPPEGTQS